MKRSALSAPLALLLPLLTAGVAHAGGITPVPASVPFGDLGVNLTSVKSVDLQNKTNAAVTVTGIALVGPDVTEFALNAPGTPLTLMQGGHIGVDVTFKPTGASGPRNATLQLTVKDEMNTTDIPLTGNALGPTVRVTPSPVTIGGVRLGDMVTPVTVTVSNSGGGLLKVTSVAPIGADAARFSFTNFSAQLPKTLAGGELFTFVMSFTPVAKGAANIAIHVLSDDPLNPTLDAPVLAYVGDPTLTLSVREVNLGLMNVGAPTQTVQVDINNLGFSSLTITDISIVGTNPGDFNVTKPGLPKVLKVGEGTTISVGATPTALAMRAASVQITSDDPASPKLLPLQVFGTAPMGMAVPPSIDFSDVMVGTKSMQTFNINNTGDGPLQVTNLAVSGPAEFTVNVVPSFSIAPKTMKAVQVTFGPMARVPYMGSVNFSTDDPKFLKVQVPIMGRGVAPVLAVDTMMLDFGTADVGKCTDPKDVNVCNNGDAPMHVTAFQIVGPSSQLFVIANKPQKVPFDMNPMSCQAYQIQYCPRDNTGDNATLTINTNDPKSPSFQVNLSGIGAEAQIATVPMDGDTIAFPPTTVGLTSQAMTIKLQNTGTATLKIAAVLIKDGPDPDTAKPSVVFGVSLDKTKPGTNSLPAFEVPVQGNGNPGYVNLYVTFFPNEEKMFDMHQLEITPDPGDPNLQPVHFLLSGTGTKSQVTCFTSDFTSTIDFGQVQVGTVAGPVALAIKNDSTMATPVFISTDKGQFTFDKAMVTVPSMMVAKVNVSFMPDAVGKIAANLKVGLSAGSTASVCGMLVLKGEGTTEQVMGDGSVDVPIGRGCSVAPAGRGPAGMAIMLLLFGAGLVARRRRRIG